MRRALIALAVGAVAGGLPAPAVAAPYSITRCTYTKLPTAPAGTRSPVLSSQGTVPNDLCGDGFGYRFDFSNHTLNTSASGRTGMRFQLAPTTPDLSILSISARLTLLAKTGDGSSKGDLAFVDETNGSATSVLASWSGGSTGQIGPGDYTTPAGWKPTRSVLLGATCATTCTFGSGSNRDLKIEKLTFVLDDPSPPSEPTFRAGGLLAPGPVQGTVALSLTAADNGSGVERVEVLTPAGALLATTPPGDGCRANYAETCPPTRDVDLLVDTTVLVPGPQQLSVRLFNGAGLSRTVPTPTFTVPGQPADATVAPPQPVANGDSLGASTITARKGSPGTRNRLTTAYGRTVRLRGRLLNRSKQAMPGVELTLLRTAATAGATASVLSTVATDPTGAYDVRVPATASATLTLAYARHRGAGDYESTRALSLVVVPDVALRAKRSTVALGAKTTFTGRITFAPQPSPGTPVGIQVLRRGRWQTIDVVTLRDAGRFTWTHRFGARGAYRFRARTFKSAALPTATSAAARLRVR